MSTNGRAGRRFRRSSVALAGAAAFAVLAGSLLGATAANADALSTDGCAATVAGCATESASLDSVRLGKSVMVVYPEATGYQDTVDFSVRGLSAESEDVPITGTAELRKDDQLVASWPLADAATTLTWDGHMGSKVVAGVYTLGVTAWSADGTVRSSSMPVLVSAKHLVTRTVMIRTRNLAKATTDNLPVQVAIGLKYGPVSLRIHTVAKVHGKADILISIPGLGEFPVPLKNGKHVTGPIPVQPGFLTAKFGHDWKKKDATLLSMVTVFTYRELAS